MTRIVTIPGNLVEPSTERLATRSYVDQFKKTLGNKKFEAFPSGMPSLVERGQLNPLFDAAFMAFNDHRPLVLSPDIVWLAIVQAFAMHVNANAETLRSRFVSHEGKQRIELRRNAGFVPGNPNNHWEGLFSEFSEKIEGIVGSEKHSLIVQSFSTSGPIEKAAFEVTLMDAFQSYFQYGFTTCCGIPEFQLEGEVNDWKRVRAAAETLGGYAFDWWMPLLLPFLDEFVAASEGNPDTKFWRSFFNIGGASGGPFINGHILTLFPYTKRAERNPFLFQTQSHEEFWNYDGITTDKIPGGFACAPVEWTIGSEKHQMEFIAGFVGVEQNENTLALRPRIGWAVCYADVKGENS